MPLDGRPMKIEMASDAKSVINPTRVQQPLMIGRRRGIGAGRITKRGGGRGGQVRRYRGTGVGGGRGTGGRGRASGRARGAVGGRGGAAGGRGGRRGGRGGRGGKKTATTPPNKDQLDKELDSFMSSR